LADPGHTEILDGGDFVAWGQGISAMRQKGNGSHTSQVELALLDGIQRRGRLREQLGRELHGGIGGGSGLEAGALWWKTPTSKLKTALSVDTIQPLYCVR
jgi:hypothetical protein